MGSLYWENGDIVLKPWNFVTIGHVQLPVFGMILACSIFIANIWATDNLMKYNSSITETDVPLFIISPSFLGSIVRSIYNQKIKYFNQMVKEFDFFNPSSSDIIYSKPNLASLWYNWTSADRSIIDGILGGLLGIFYFAYRRRISTTKILGLIIEPLILGIAIGRIGCILTLDGCEGPEIPGYISFLVKYPNGHNHRIFPTPLIESISLFFCLIVLKLGPKLRHEIKGGLGLTLIGLIRLFLERFRDHGSEYNVNSFRIVALSIAVIGILFLLEQYIRNNHEVV